MPSTCRMLAAIIYGSTLLGMVASPGQLTAQETDFQLPANPGNWINTPPINMDVLAGKAAVLYYFEES